MRNVFTDIEPWDEEIDPMKSAQDKMKTKLPKRFYEKADISATEDGYRVVLDGRTVKTPAKRDLILPNEAVAHMVADEFSMQQDVINPATMPMTRLANTVIDGIADDPQPVAEDLLRFLSTDMLFYRAANPQELIERQITHWDPVLDWAAARFGAHFEIGEGVMHIEQPREAIAAVSSFLRTISSPFALAALHTMTTLTGSALIALAIAEGELEVARGWTLAHLDEDWTIEQWGEDEEAMARRRFYENEIYAAAALLAATKSDSNAPTLDK